MKQPKRKRIDPITLAECPIARRPRRSTRWPPPTWPSSRSARGSSPAWTGAPSRGRGRHRCGGVPGAVRAVHTGKSSSRRLARARRGKKHARSDPRAGNKRRSHRTKSGARVRPASAMARPRSYPKTLRSIEKIVRSTTATKTVPLEIATLQQSLDTYIVSPPMSTPPETRQSMRLCQKLERSVSRSLESLLTDTPKSPTFLSDPHAHTVAVRRALHHEARSHACGAR